MCFSIECLRNHNPNSVCSNHRARVVKREWSLVAYPLAHRVGGPLQTRKKRKEKDGEEHRKPGGKTILKRDMESVGLKS